MSSYLFSPWFLTAASLMTLNLPAGSHNRRAWHLAAPPCKQQRNKACAISQHVLDWFAKLLKLPPSYLAIQPDGSKGLGGGEFLHHFPLPRPRAV